MKKILLLILPVLVLFGCSSKAMESFGNLVEKSESYIATGVLESFFENGKKENSFSVYYKKPGNLKIVFSENDNKQVVLKNNEGVYILIPAVNKNFKIDSSWPDNASYPYLLDSIKKDLEKTEVNKTETDTSIIYETKSKMFNDSVETKEEVIIDKKTNLPLEVKVYDKNDELYLRVTFTEILINPEISDEEFAVNEIMTYLRNEELTVFSKREFLLPSYIPEGYQTSKEDTLVTGSGDELTSIMKFTGVDSFTVIQEFVNDSEDLKTVMTNGEFIYLLGNVGIFKGESIEVYSDGIMYTLASQNIGSEELIKIMTSYFTIQEK